MINKLVNKAHSSLMPLLRKRVLFFVVLTLGILMFIQVVLFKSYLSNKTQQHSDKLNLHNSEVFVQTENINSGHVNIHTDAPIDDEDTPMIENTPKTNLGITERHQDDHDNNVVSQSTSHSTQITHNDIPQEQPEIDPASINSLSTTKKTNLEKVKKQVKRPSSSSGASLIDSESELTLPSQSLTPPPANDIQVTPKKEKKQLSKKPTNIPTVHYLFMCDRNELSNNNNCMSDEEWISKIKNQVPNDVKMQQPTDSSRDQNIKVNFVLFSTSDRPPSQIKDDSSKQMQFVQIVENNIQKTVNNYVKEMVKDDYDMIVFIHGNSFPISFSYYQTWDMLDEMDQVGSITILSKTAKIKTVGWNIRARSCDGKSKAFSLVKHLAGYDVTIFSDYNLNKNGNPKHAKSRFDDDVDIFLPDFNGLSMLKKTFISVQGFNEKLHKDYALDLMLKVSKNSFSSLFSLDNIIQSFDHSAEDEEIVFRNEKEVSQRCGNSPSSARSAEASLHSVYYETMMSTFNDRLFLRNVELVYTITSLDSTILQEAATNLAALEGKVMITLKVPQDLENNAISLSKQIEHLAPHVRNVMNRIESMSFVQAQATNTNQKVYFNHGNPPQFSCPTGSSLCIGKTAIKPSSETKIPSDWVKSCNSAVDQVWVSSKFSFEVLRSAGVKKKKLVFVPTGIDTKMLRPRVKFPNSKSASSGNMFKFLTILDWNNKRYVDLRR